MEVDYKKAGGSSWTRVNMYSGLLLGQSHTSCPGKHGVEDGASIRLYVNIEAGTHAEASEEFIYQSGSSACANDVCSGTTLSPHLGLESVS